MFNDELDLLEIRLRLLDDVVDTFFIVEGDLTFSGKRRSISLDPLPERLAPWAGRIQHRVITLPVHAADTWERENAQRRGLREVLGLADPTDLILLGDVDEFPRPEVVLALSRASLPRPMRLQMMHCIFSVNLALPLRWNDGTFGFRTEHATDRMIDVQFGKDGRSTDWSGYKEMAVRDAGWHCSFPGQETDVQSKLEAYSHQELNRDGLADAKHLRRCLDLQVHFAGDGPMRRVPDVDLTPLIEEVRHVAPSMVAVGSDPAAVRSLAYSLVSAMRRRGGILKDVIDRLDRPVFAPLLAVIERYRIRRRAARGLWKEMEFTQLDVLRAD